MKKIVIVVSAVLLMISCKPEAPKDYVTLSGTITNPNSDSLIVAQRQIIKTIKVNEDGRFSDTLKVVTGMYNFFDGAESTSIYLKNGFDLVISLDTKQFDESISFTGEGAEVNNYLAARALMQEDVFENDSLFELEKPVFDEKIREIKESFNSLLTKTQKLDSLFIADVIKADAILA